MHRKRVLLQSLLILLLVWGVVTAIRAYAGSKKITADKVAAEVNAAAFEDWSEGPGSSATAKQREEKLREIAGLVNRLDFNERERNREDRSVEQMFRRLSGDEKRLFIDLTVRESMARFMEALDKLPPAERKKFVEKGLEEIKSGKTGEELARADELGDGLLETITNEGMRACFEKANADTKLDLAPLMESMNELMQGLRGQEFGSFLAMKSTRPGFTLTELLVVLAIIGALAAIAIPAGRAVKARSRTAGCLSNLRQIGIGLESYLQDNNQTMPDIAAGRKSKAEDVPVLETALATYLPDSKVFHCPADHKIHEKSGRSYIWNSSQSGRHRLRLEFFGKTGQDNRIPLVSDKESWHPGESGVNFLYADLSASTKVNFGVSP